VTSRNVVIASNPTGNANSDCRIARVVGKHRCLYRSQWQQLRQPAAFVHIESCGDTQLLGNFEYRIPLISDKVSAALFTDVGSAF